MTLSHPHRLDRTRHRAVRSPTGCVLPLNSNESPLAVQSARSLCRLTAPRPRHRVGTSKRSPNRVVACQLDLRAQTQTIYNHVCRTGPRRGHLHGQAERAGACRRLLFRGAPSVSHDRSRGHHALWTIADETDTFLDPWALPCRLLRLAQAERYDEVGCPKFQFLPSRSKRAKSGARSRRAHQLYPTIKTVN